MAEIPNMCQNVVENYLERINACNTLRGAVSWCFVSHIMLTLKLYNKKGEISWKKYFICVLFTFTFETMKWITLYFVLPSFTAKLIIIDSRSVVLKVAVTYRLVSPMISMLSAYASNWTLFWKIVPLRWTFALSQWQWHTYIISRYNRSVRIIKLVSHTTYINFIRKWLDQKSAERKSTKKCFILESRLALELLLYI